jgi:sialidase-1
METLLFIAGTLGYASYRIPVVMALPKRRILVFCEGRVNSAADHGLHRLLSRASDDAGETFGEQKVVAAEDDCTLGNPCPVYDRNTGRLWLFYNVTGAAITEKQIVSNQGERKIKLLYSDDLGDTWSQPADMTSKLSRPNWTIIGQGPCHGLQTKSGRLVIPCKHAVYPLMEHAGYFSHSVYSSDHGETWILGGDIGPDSNECSVAEIQDNILYMSVRRHPYDSGWIGRAYSISKDGGITWTDAVSDNALPDPHCQGSVINETEIGSGGFYPLYLTNAADNANRTNLTIRGSLDGGKTWTNLKTAEDPFAAYSDIAILEDRRFAWVYECGKKEGYEGIKLVIGSFT